MPEKRSPTILGIENDESKALAARSLRTSFAAAIGEGFSADDIKRLLAADNDALQNFKTENTDQQDRELLAAAKLAHHTYHSELSSNHSNYAASDAMAIAGGAEGMKKVALHDVVVACDRLMKEHNLPIEALLAFAEAEETHPEVERVAQLTDRGPVSTEGFWGDTGHG